jgi:hypothetical protein
VNVDEMDLLRQGLEVPPWRQEDYDRARTRLQSVAAQPGVTPLRGSAFTRPAPRRWSLSTRGKLGLGAGLGAVAASAALVLAVTATPAPKTSTESPLISLAAYITADTSSQTGNASLVIRTQTIGKGTPDVSYNLYTDSGAFYGGADKKSLAKAVSLKQDESAGITGREVAAADAAAKGNLADARKQMVNASPNDLGLGLSAAQRQVIWDKAIAQSAEALKAKGVKLPAHPPTGKLLEQRTGNAIWNNSVDALSAGAGNAQVRAGVLRLLAGVPEVKVAKTTTAKQATLTITAGSALFGGGSPEVLVINAKTGMPITSSFKASGKLSASKASFVVSRLTLDAVKAGKF